MGSIHLSLSIMQNLTPLLHAVQPLNTSSALPIPSEEPATIWQGIPVTASTCASDVKSLGVGQRFQLLLFVPHAVGIIVETFQVWYFGANTW